MKDKSNWVGETIGTMIAFAFCLGIAWGFFGLGLMLADWLLGGKYRSEVGLLSAVTVVWLYESQTSYRRWQSLNERLDRLWAKVNGLD